VALAGCKSKPVDEPLPKQPDAPTKPDVVATLGKDLDKTDHRVASALVAIERNADKPKVVVAESRLAQSYLPQPPEADVAFAVARATKADPLDYAKQMEFGRKTRHRRQQGVGEARSPAGRSPPRLSAEGRPDRRTPEGGRAREEGRIVSDLDARRRRPRRHRCFVHAFLGPRIGIPLLLCGAFCGSVPFIIDSPFFMPLAVGTIAIAAGLGLWWLWDKVRDAVNKPSQSTHDEPPQA